MATFEFAIRAYNQEDLACGHKRSKQGDIIACHPAPWNWGKKEQTGYLFVTIDGITQEIADALCSFHYSDGILRCSPDPESGASIIAKRRFNVPIEKLETITGVAIDKKELESNKKYQPIKAIKLNFLKADIFYDKQKNAFSKAAILSKVIK